MTTTPRTTILTDARRLYGTTARGRALEQKAMAADPTDSRALDAIAVELAALGMTNATRNTALELRYEILQQEEENTRRALGWQKPAVPSLGDPIPNRGGDVSTAAGNRLAAIDHGELRKRAERVSPVLRSDGSVDEVATSMKIMHAAAGERFASSRHPWGGRSR